MRSLDPDRIRRVVSEHGTPVYAYDADVLRAQTRSLQAFDVVRYAQKACSNTHILKLLRAEGALVDSVSLGELERAARAGFTPDGEPPGVVFTADIFNGPTLDRVVEADIPVNAGSEDMLSQLGERKRGHKVWLRVNPGFGSGHSRKTSTGGESSKHGIWHENLPGALERIDAYDLDLVGLHMHIGSGADIEHLKRVCRAMVDCVRSIERDVRAISGGGGLPIPYRDGESGIDVEAYFGCWDAARREVEEIVGHRVLLEIEPGRYIAGASGVLVGEVRATKTMGNNFFAVVDAGFDNLLRPAMYGSWHEISLIPQNGGTAGRPERATLVGGPLCESGDVFTQESGGIVVPRELPEARVGDLLVLHDAGAYAASMASNYNSRPLAPEVLVDGDDIRLIRRRQEIDDLLALEEV